MGIAKKEVIYHLHLKNFSRSKGHNFWQGLAYRHGEKYLDEKTGKSFDYRAKSKRENIEFEFIAPGGALEELQDRKKFYDRLHDVSQSKNARFYREFEFALYNDLTKEENKQLARNFGEAISEEYGIFVDLNFHKLDSHNPHCHLVFSERTIVTKEEAEKSLGGRGKTKIEGDLGNKSFKMRNVEFLKDMRKKYADISNDFFEKLEKDIFTSEKSYKDRGINRIPQLHIPKDNEPERKLRVIELNTEIKKRNKQVEFKEKALSLRETTQERLVQTRKSKSRIIDLRSKLKTTENERFDELTSKNVVTFVLNHAKNSSKERQKEEKRYTTNKKTNKKYRTKEDVQLHFLHKELRREKRIEEKLKQRREVRKMAEKKFMDMHNGVPVTAKPLDDFEVLMKNSVKLTTKAAIRTVQFAGGVMQDAFRAKRDNARSMSDKLSVLADRQNKRLQSMRSFREESYSKFLDSRDDRRHKIADKKLSISEKRIEKRSLKYLSIRDFRRRSELNSEIRKDKLSIKRQKLAMQRERKIQKNLKRAYKKERLKTFGIQKERLKSFIREKQSERMMKKYKDVEIEKIPGLEKENANSKENKKNKVVSIKELKEKRRLEQENKKKEVNKSLNKDKEKENKKENKKEKEQAKKVIKIKDKNNFTKIKIDEKAMNKIKENVLSLNKDKNKDLTR